VHQAFKSDLAPNPTAVQQLLAQYSSDPPDTPGPLQRLMCVVAPHMQHLVDSWQAPGSEPLQALHKLTQQLQQVGRIPKVMCKESWSCPGELHPLQRLPPVWGLLGL
jgi:hypothetical protein